MSDQARPREFDEEKARKICDDIDLSRECTCDESDESCVYRDEKYCAVTAMKWQFEQDKAEIQKLREALEAAYENYCEHCDHSGVWDAEEALVEHFDNCLKCKMEEALSEGGAHE